VRRARTLIARDARDQSPRSTNGPSGGNASAPGSGMKDALLAEIRKNGLVIYNTVVAQAQKIDVAGDLVTFIFSANQRSLREMFEQKRAWLESIAQQATGRRLTVAAAQSESAGAASAVGGAPASNTKAAGDGGPA